MLTLRSVATIIVVLAALALLRAILPALQHFGIWLIAMLLVGPWVVWLLAKQLYTAAIHDYVLTGVPEKRVYREDNPALYRNNVIANIVTFPVVAAGVVILLLDALKAEHLIR